MNDARTARRLRLALLLALFTGLALGSFWLYEVMRRATEDALPNAERSEPDFYVEKFSYVKMSPEGKAQYLFSGSRLTPNPLDDSYDIAQPVIHNLDAARPPMTMRSDRATVNSDNSQVNMYDNVHLDRAAAPNLEPMHVASEHLLLLPDDDVVKTDKTVDITVGRSKLTGTGMYTNNATREFRLTSNVHGTYQAPLR